MNSDVARLLLSDISVVSSKIISAVQDPIVQQVLIGQFDAIAYILVNMNGSIVEQPQPINLIAKWGGSLPQLSSQQSSLSRQPFAAPYAIGNDIASRHAAQLAAVQARAAQSQAVAPAALPRSNNGRILQPGKSADDYEIKVVQDYGDTCDCGLSIYDHPEDQNAEVVQGFKCYMACDHTRVYG